MCQNILWGKLFKKRCSLIPFEYFYPPKSKISRETGSAATLFPIRIANGSRKIEFSFHVHFVIFSIFRFSERDKVENHVFYIHTRYEMFSLENEKVTQT